jgi:hypothetical protein
MEKAERSAKLFEKKQRILLLEEGFCAEDNVCIISKAAETGFFLDDISLRMRRLALKIAGNFESKLVGDEETFETKLRKSVKI